MAKLYPEVLIFACNWDGWSCIDAASNLGLRYPASVKLVRVNCLSRIHAGLILKAFDFGAEGVMLLGCVPGMCHFDADSEYIVNECEKAQRILEMLGVWRDRLVLVRLPAYDGHGFVGEVNKLMEEIDRIPPSKRSKLIRSRPTQHAKV